MGEPTWRDSATDVAEWAAITQTKVSAISRSLIDLTRSIVRDLAAEEPRSPFLLAQSEADAATAKALEVIQDLARIREIIRQGRAAGDPS